MSKSMTNEVRARKFIKWIGLFILLLIPCLWIPGKFAELKFADMIQSGNLENCIEFHYAGDRQTACYPANFIGETDTEVMRYVFLPSFADLDEIRVETLADHVEFVKDGEIITVARGKDKVCSFEKNVPYILNFYRADGELAGTRNVMFLKSGKLPTLYVNTDSGSMEQLDADKKYKEKGTMELLDENGNVLFLDEIKNISGRGNHTFTYDKKSYQIRLRDPADLLNMGASDTWILLCNVFDTSYVRNKLTYDMALQADMPGSPRSEYIDVYLNGIYNGMYLLCEKVEFGENRLEFTDLESQNRKLNGNNLDNAYRFETEDGKQKGVELLRNPEDITGGYLIEHDYRPKYDEVLSGFKTDRGERYSLKNPQHASREEIAYISGLMQEIEDAIFAEDGINPNTGKSFTEYIDLESWADKYLVEEITSNNGGGLSSSYFYKPQDSVSTKVFGGPVWDYDKSLGRVPDFNKNTRNLNFLTLHETFYTQWFYELYKKEEFVEAVKKEYREKFSDYLEVMAEKKVDEYLSCLNESASLDTVRFAYIYNGYGEDLDYVSKAQSVKEFLSKRKKFLDKVWLEDAPVCRVCFQDENGKPVHYFGVIKGECIEEFPLPEDEEKEFLGWRIEGTETFLTTETEITEDMTVVCVWKG